MTKSDLKIKLEEWKKELKLNELSEKTIINYSSDISKFILFVSNGSNDDDEEITKEHLINWKSDLKEKGFKTTSINRKIISLNKFFSFCGDENFTIKNIRIQKKSTIENLLTENELKRILNFAEKKEEYLIYYGVKTLALTGLRYSELKYITCEACRDKKVKIENKGKVREIPLEKNLAKELLEWAKSRDITSGMIFITKNGKFILNEQFSRKLKEVTGKAHGIKLSKVHPHAFRHFFAVNLLETVNNNFAEVADLLGHSSLETTRIYLRTTLKEQREHITNMSKKLKIN